MLASPLKGSILRLCDVAEPSPCECAVDPYSDALSLFSCCTRSSLARSMDSYRVSSSSSMHSIHGVQSPGFRFGSQSSGQHIIGGFSLPLGG